MREKKSYDPEGKKHLELDVDRMINEGMAGGKPTRPVYGREQIGETHPIPEEDHSES